MYTNTLAENKLSLVKACFGSEIIPVECSRQQRAVSETEENAARLVHANSSELQSQSEESNLKISLFCVKHLSQSIYPVIFRI